MRAFLDDKPLTFDRKTFAGALRAAVAAAEGRGRVIVDVLLDGTTVGDEVLSDPPDVAMGDELRLVSAEPKALVRVTLTEAADALARGAAAQTRAAELIQAGRVKDAFAPLGEVVQTWHNVHEAVSRGTDLLNMNIDGERVALEGGRSVRVSEAAAELARCLEELKRSLSLEDWPALSDVLAFDLADQARVWRAVLVHLAERLRPGA